jgi:hypothetical protein
MVLRINPFDRNGSTFSMLFPMEPSFTTAPELQPIIDELSAREPIFHRPEFGTTREDFERMTTEDYWETGASGRQYSRAAVLDELEKRFSVRTRTYGRPANSNAAS